MLHALARDNQDEVMLDGLVASHPDAVLAVATRTLEDGQARWQMAVA